MTRSDAIARALVAREPFEPDPMTIAYMVLGASEVMQIVDQECLASSEWSERAVVASVVEHATLLDSFGHQYKRSHDTSWFSCIARPFGAYIARALVAQDATAFACVAEEAHRLVSNPA